MSIMKKEEKKAAPQKGKGTTQAPAGKGSQQDAKKNSLFTRKKK